MNRPQILTRFAVLIIGLTGILTASAQEPDSLLIDLNRALEIALSENPTVKVADMEITKKQYAQKSAYGGLFSLSLMLSGSISVPLKDRQSILMKVLALVAVVSTQPSIHQRSWRY